MIDLYNRQTSRRRGYLFIFSILVIMTMSIACSKSTDTRQVPSDTTDEKEFTVYTYNVINKYPHDTAAFTQGLVIDSGLLYEGTGKEGFSTLRKLQVETYDTLLLRNIPDRPTRDYFGEGISILGDKIFQLTWQSKVGFIYDKRSFSLLNQFTYPTEGWGLTFDSSHFIMSDGSAFLYFRDTITFEEISRVEVRDSVGPIIHLNELEYIDGEVWANIWLTSRIIRIDPATGKVIGLIDFQALVNEARNDYSRADVLNGIAYDTENDRLFVTGKNWPWLYEIKVVPVVR